MVASFFFLVLLLSLYIKEMLCNSKCKIYSAYSCIKVNSPILKCRQTNEDTISLPTSYLQLYMTNDLI